MIPSLLAWQQKTTLRRAKSHCRKTSKSYEAKRHSARSIESGIGDQSVFPCRKRPGVRDEISYWDGARSGDRPRIIIDLEQQRAYFYEGGEVVGVSVVSTGREGYDTHQALDAIVIGIRYRKVNWVLDADIRRFFDTNGIEVFAGAVTSAN